MKEKPAYHFKKAPYHAFVVADNNCGLHLHRHAEISYMIEGEQLFTIDNVTYTIQAGDLIVVFPNQLHQLSTPVSSNAFTGIFDAYLTSDFTDKLTNYHFRNCVFHKEELAQTTLEALEELAKTGISKSFKMHAVPFMEKGYLSVILADLFSKHDLIPYEPTSPSFIISSFFNYVETHLAEDLSLNTIAHALNMSPSRLSSCITYNTGRTPHALVNSRRLDHARTMLYKTDKSIPDIARETGFASDRSFYRNFKEMYQKTPIEFRKKKTAAKD